MIAIGNGHEIFVLDGDFFEKSFGLFDWNDRVRVSVNNSNFLGFGLFDPLIAGIFFCEHKRDWIDLVELFCKIV